MHKKFSFLVLLALSLVLFAGCFKKIEDNVIIGINNIDNNEAVLYIDFPAVFAVNNIKLESYQRYAVSYYAADGSFDGGQVEAKQDMHGWGVKLPFESSVMRINLAIKTGSQYASAGFLDLYDSQYQCGDFAASNLCVVLTELAN